MRDEYCWRVENVISRHLDGLGVAYLGTSSVNATKTHVSLFFSKSVSQCSYFVLSVHVRCPKHNYVLRLPVIKKKILDIFYLDIFIPT